MRTQGSQVSQARGCNLVASDRGPLNLFLAEPYAEVANRSEGGCVSACTEEAQTASQRENASRFLSDLCSRHPLMLRMLGLFSAASLLIYFVCLAFLPQMDFRVYRMGAQHLFGPSLYSSELTVLSRHLLFTYPPVAAVLFWPFPPLCLCRSDAVGRHRHFPPDCSHCCEPRSRERKRHCQVGLANVAHSSRPDWILFVSGSLKSGSGSNQHPSGAHDRQ